MAVAPIDAAPETPGQVHYLRKPIAASYAALPEAARQRLHAAGAVNVEDYGAFVVVTAQSSAKPADIENAAGLSGLLYPGAFDLDLGGAVIDYRLADRGRYEKSPELFVDDYLKGARGLYVVKLVGPPRREWLEGLARAGALGREPARAQGWGRLGLVRAIEDTTPRRLLDEDKEDPPVYRFTSSGGYKNVSFTVADPSKEIVVVLAYTDAPAQPGASVARVKELDLHVLQGGAVYCDGQHTGQYSTRSTGCWLPDMYNNVKRARIAPNSFSGTFTVQVVAGSVTQKAVPGLDAGANQDWALHVYNAY